MDAQLQADLDKIEADWRALTVEDLHELDAQHGYGICKACETSESESFWRGPGDIYCWDCVWQLKRECGMRDDEFELILTREQIATAAEWERQGIGAN